MRKIINLIIVLSILFLSGCAVTPETIRDIRELPQDHASFLDPGRTYLPDAEQQELDTRYNTRYFSPWHRDKPVQPLSQVVRPFLRFEKYPGYGENRRKRDAAWIKKLLDSAGLDNYPNAGFAAITTDNTDLRALPTHKPVFSYSNGYPFDRLQESLIAANTPLFISHMTADRSWFLVETPYAHGWIKSRDVAFTDPDFTKKWENGRYTVVIRDKTPFYDNRNHFLFRAPLGSIFPLLEETGCTLHVLVASPDLNRQAVIGTASLSKESAALKPVKMTGTNLIRTANELINETYGWGGLYENRDCSAMIKDFFAPFGLWLSRHSSDQAKKDGVFIDLRGFSPEEKEKMIIQQGIPYLTLLWIKGHIMLYIGVHRGHPLVFHNFWGARTTGFLGRSERIIVGHAAVTTLQPGREQGSVMPPAGDYLHKIAGMTLLVDPAELQKDREASDNGKRVRIKAPLPHSPD